MICKRCNADLPAWAVYPDRTCVPCAAGAAASVSERAGRILLGTLADRASIEGLAMPVVDNLGWLRAVWCEDTERALVALEAEKDPQVDNLVRRVREYHAATKGAA